MRYSPQRPAAPTPPTNKQRVALCLLENGGAALSIRNIAILVGTRIEPIKTAVAGLREMGLITGPQSAVCLTQRGEEFAERNRGYVPQD
jgi:hypothetical protein